MMEFEGEFTVDGSPEELWSYFTDPNILQDCAPGCEEVTLVSPSHVTSTLSVGVGSIKPSFDVKGIVAEYDRPNRLELRATGEASRNSFEATASQELKDNGDGTTSVRWAADARVSGIIASMGERALGSVADQLVNNFFNDLEEHVNAGTPAESRFEAASPEELAEWGYEPDVEADAVAADSDSSRGSPVGELMESSTGTSDGEVDSESVNSGGTTLYTALGGILGVTCKLLWDRYHDTTGGERRDGTREETGASSFSITVSIDRDAVGSEQSTTPQAVPEERGGAAFLLWGVVIGVVGKLLWDGWLTASDKKGGVQEVPNGQKTVDGQDDSDEQGRTEESDEGATDEEEKGVVGDDSADDPLDRLSSR